MGFFIVPGDVAILCIENCTQFVANQIYNGLEVQLGGKSLLDGVDDLQLGFTLSELLFKRRWVLTQSFLECVSLRKVC